MAVAGMLFERQFERLYFAVERIAGQLAYADEDQRRYLCDELDALRAMGSGFFDLWVSFEDQVQDLLEEYGAPGGASHGASGAQDAAPQARVRIGREAQLTAADQSVAPKTRTSAAPTGRSPQNWIDGTSSLLDTADGLQLFRKGLGYFDLFMFEESKRAFAGILERDPDLAVARLYLALCHLSSGEAAEAERQLSVVERSSAEEALLSAAREAKAQLYAASGRFLEAAQELQSVVLARPGDGDAHFNAAVCFFAVADYKRAAGHARRAMELSPGDVQAWRVHGAAQFEAGKTAMAVDAYRQAVILSPNEGDILCEAAQVLRHAGQHDEAAALYEQALTSDARDARAITGLAWIALERREPVKAVGLLKKAVCLDPNSERRLGQLGYGLCLADRLDESERVFSALLRSHAHPLVPLSGLARVAVLRGDRSTAIALLRRVLLLDDHRAKVHGLTELARIFADRRKWRAALRCLSTALAMDARDRDALLCLGSVLQAAGIDTADGLPDTGVIGGVQTEARD